MHHRVSRFHVHHFLVAQPVEELIAVVRMQYVIERVAAMGLAHTGRDDEQMQIVIAEHRHGALPQAAHEAQRFDRLRPAVDQIADEPQRVVRRIEAQRVDDSSQLVVAALDVADGVDAHVPGKRWMMIFERKKKSAVTRAFRRARMACYLTRLTM